ncbi:hypothetical protein DEV91_1728 [Phyllobacterium brassicacearum]|nr:hypothetical protein DEV91_1728 [Phyllobacterium brassicacearum]
MSVLSRCALAAPTAAVAHCMHLALKLFARLPLMRVVVSEVAFRLTIRPLTHVEQRRSRRFKGKGYFLNGVEGNVALLPFDAAEIGLGQSGAQGNLFLRDSKLCPADAHIAGEKLTQRKRVERVHCDRDS